MSQEIRMRVLAIVAYTANVKPDDVRFYFRLRKKKDDIPGLNMDSDLIDSLQPPLLGLLKPYKQPITTAEVNDPKAVVTISDLADLVEKKIDAANQDRLRKVTQETVGWLSTETGVSENNITETSVLRNVPLSLDDAAIEQFRDALNDSLKDYGLVLPITVPEMTALVSVGDVFKQIQEELKKSNTY